MTAKSGTISAEVRLDETNDTYGVGAEIEGTFVHFATVPGAAVRAAIANTKANEAAPAEAA